MTCYLHGKQIRYRKVGLYTGELWVLYWFNRKAENNDAEYKNDVPENGNAKYRQVVINEKAKRPQWARRPPDTLNVLTSSNWWNLRDAAAIALVNIEEATTIEEDLSSVNSKVWQEAFQSEYDSLKQNQTRDLFDIPAIKNIVGSK